VSQRAEEASVVRFIPASDELLVQRAQEGDRASERAIFERHSTHLARVLARVLGDTDDVGDLLHEVFLRAFRNLDQIRDPRALRSWLTGIAVHVARAEIRKRKRRRWLAFFAPEELPEPSPESPSDADSDAAHAVMRVLDQLPVDHRIVFALRYIAGMQLDEIAVALEVSLATTKRRLARAQAAFMLRAAERPELRTYIAEDKPWPR
jgi:RNA polymerase sigma-70 factor (ECF subfamily)